MKRRLEQLVNGRFEYEVPHLLLSNGAIFLGLISGKNYRGEISIGAEDGRKIKGFAASDHQRIILAKDRFSGTVSTVAYGIDVVGLAPGDTINGTITISSNIEERQIPVTVRILEEQISSSEGEVETLEAFTHLASRDFREAFSLFGKEAFEKFLTQENKRYLALHRGMSEKPVNYQHLEEFLVSAGQKEPIVLTLDKKKKALYSIDASMKDTLYLYKNTWGYVLMDIEVQGDFLEVEKKVVTSEDFIGSVYGLDYIVRRERLGAGRHYGKIIIRSVHQELVFEIEACAEGYRNPARPGKKKELTVQLLRGYLALLTHKADYRSWYDQSWQQVQALRSLGSSDLKLRFFEAFLYDTNEEPEKAREVLLELRERQIPLDTAEEQGLYLYFSRKLGLPCGGHGEMVNRLQSLCRQEPTSFLLQKLLMEEDDSYRESLTKQLYAMEQLFDMGCTSPFLYCAAARVLLRQEGQLRRMSPFMVQVLRFAQREDLLTEELLKRAAYLSGHLKNFDQAVYRFLAKGYEKFPSDEVLEAVCKLIMKGHPSRKEYFPWYALAVDHEIRITRLYEYYIETMSDQFQGVLPQVIRMYFSYSNTLSSRKKAFVYANVIRNKESDRNTYQSYRRAMAQFASAQVTKRRINEDYAVIYREFLQAPTDPVSASAIAEVLFTKKVVCQDQKIRRVIVCHYALQEERAYPLVGGVAYVQIYSPDAQILLEDETKRRFATTIPYTVEPLFEEQEFARICGSYHVEHPGLLLYLCQEQPSRMELNPATLPWYQQAAEQQAFTVAYRRAVERKLLAYYLEHPDEETVEAAVYTMDDREYARVDKIGMVRLLVEKGQYVRAFELTEKFGYEQIPKECLLKLASHMILIREFAEDEELLYLAAYVFHQGLYDEILLCYLRDYYTGSVEQMCELWEKVKGFQMESDKLEEQILTRAMFVRKYPVQDQKILESYIMQTGREIVILAYLTYISIGYFMENYQVSERLFGYLERIYEKNWELDEICRLALLKYYASRKELSAKQERYAARFLMEFDQKGLRFSFYQKLPSQLTEVYQVNDRIFVEERLSSDAKAVIHYRIGEDGEWKSEPMRNMYQGIFVKEFLLFYGESLEYYLTVEREKEYREYPRKTIRMTENEEKGRTRYQLLNNILAARTIGNTEQTEKAFRQYLQQEALVQSCFSMLE